MKKSLVPKKLLENLGKQKAKVKALQIKHLAAVSELKSLIAICEQYQPERVLRSDDEPRMDRLKMPCSRSKLFNHSVSLKHPLDESEP